MKDLTVKLEPTGYAQPIDDIEPGLFVILRDGMPVSAGVKTEYGQKPDAYNEAGEFCSGCVVMPVKVVVELEEQ